MTKEKKMEILKSIIKNFLNGEPNEPDYSEFYNFDMEVKEI